MGRKLVKKWIVDTYTDVTYDISVPISVDPKEGGFWAEYPPDEIITADTKDECRHAVRRSVKQLNTLEWFPFIAVCPVKDVGHSFGRGYDYQLKRDPEWAPPYVGFEQLIRYEKASLTKVVKEYGEEKEREVVRYRRWGATDSEGDYQSRVRHGSIVLPYNEALWDKLKVIEEACKEMHRNFRALLEADTPEDLTARLLSLGGGPALLTGPSEDSS